MPQEKLFRWRIEKAKSDSDALLKSLGPDPRPEPFHYNPNEREIRQDEREIRQVRDIESGNWREETPSSVNNKRFFCGEDLV